jgi:hypothetical protein
MKRIVWASLLVGLLFVSFLCAAMPQQIIPLSNSLYDDVDSLYLLTGLPSASWSRPWTVTEARMIMDRLPAILTPEAERIRDRVMQTLDEQPKWKLDDSTSLSLHLDANLEGYFHTNTEEYTSYLDWNYSYTERQPLLRARLDASFFNRVYLGMEAQYGYGLTARQSLDPQDLAFYTFTENTNVGAYVSGSCSSSLTDLYGTITPSKPGLRQYLYQSMFQSNGMLNPNDWEYTWPKRAVFSFGGEHWNVNVSRDRLSWGNARIGNFMYDNHLDFMDYLRFSLFSRNFKFETVYGFYTPFPHQSSGNTTETSTNGIETGIRMMLSHRFEFTWWDRVKLSISEGLMYYNSNGSLNASYFNPALIFHNLSDSNLFNSLLTLELDYTVAPQWNLYLQFCMDQAKAYNEEGNNNEPGAGGLALGMRHANVVMNGIYTTDVELVGTLPALYRRDGVDFIIAQRHIRLVTDESAFYYVYDYLGFPYGGGVLALQWRNSWSKEGLKLEGNLFSLLHGDIDMFSSVDEVNATSFLSGDLLWTNVLSSQATYTWELWHLTLVGRLDLIGKTTYLEASRKLDGFSFDAQFVGSVRYTW